MQLHGLELIPQPSPLLLNLLIGILFSHAHRYVQVTLILRIGSKISTSYLGSNWWILGTLLDDFPCCHNPVESLIELMPQHYDSPVSQPHSQSQDDAFSTFLTQ